MFKVCPRCGRRVLAEYFKQHERYCVKPVPPPVVTKYVLPVDEQREIRKEMYEPTIVGREWGCFLKLVDNKLRKYEPRMGYRYHIYFKFPAPPFVVGKLHYHPLYLSFSVRDIASHILFAKELKEPRRWIEILTFPDYSFVAWLYPKRSEIQEAFHKVVKETPYEIVKDTMLKFGFDTAVEAISYLTWFEIEHRKVEFTGMLELMEYEFKFPTNSPTYS